MTLRDQLSAADQPDLVEADSLMEADGLIADLAALVDAGLVVVQEHVLGPARYDVAPSYARGPKVRAARRDRTPQSPGFSDRRRPGVSVGSPP
jgi:hypothetical protein